MANENPDIALSSGSTTATEQTTLTIDGLLTVSDVDSATLASATVAIGAGFSATEDALGFVNQAGMGNIAGSYDAQTGVLALTSAGGTATMGEWQAALRAVTYLNSSDTPSGSRTITFAVDDGAGGTDSGSVSVSITALNDAPVNGVPSGTQEVAQFEAFVFSQALGNAISISDADIDVVTGEAQVTLTVTNGVLTLAQTTGLTFSAGDGTGDATMTFTGQLGLINLALDGLTYLSATLGADSLTITTSDQGGQGQDPGLTGGPSDEADTDVIALDVTDQNAPPVNTFPGGPLAATEETQAFVSGISIADADAGSGDLTATLSVDHGVLSVVNTTGVDVTGNGTASVQLTGTLAELNAAFAAANNIAYVSATDFNGQDTLTMSSTDNGATGPGGPKSDTDSVAIEVTGTPDPGAFTGVGPAPTYVENGAAIVIDDDITVTDPDLDVLIETNGDWGGATLTVQRSGGANAADILDFTGYYIDGGLLTDGDNTYGAASIAGGVLTIDFASSPTLITSGVVNAILRSITYANASEAPPASVVLEYSMDDGLAAPSSVTTASVTVNITRVNDAPTAVITPPSYSAIEQQVLDLKGTGWTVGDLDSGVLDVTVTVSVGSGVLTIVDGTSNVVIEGSGTSTVTISGTQQRVNALFNSDPSSVVTYTANLNAPPASTTLTLLIADNGATGQGGALTAQDTATINITPVNDAPSGTDGEVITPPQQTYVFAVADFGFSDPADAGANAFASVVINTLTAQGELRLGNVAISAGDEITAVQLSGGQFTFVPGPGDGGDNFASFTFQVRDNGGTANSGVNFDPTPNTLTIDVNAAPVLQGLTAAAYVENAVGAALSLDLSLSDRTAALAGAQVTIQAGLQPGDLLTADTSGTPIFASYDADTGVLTLTGAGSPGQYQQVLRTVAFVSYSDNPTDFGAAPTRTIGWSVDDGQFQTTDVSTLAITAVNDNPDINVAGGPPHASGDGPQAVPVQASPLTVFEQIAAAVDATLTVRDVDNLTLASASVAITGGFAAGQDMLAFINLGGMGNIAGSYDAGAGILTLSSAGATATVDQWQTALRTVTYVNTSDTPSTATRTVTFTVNDGAGGSDADSRQLTVTAVDDAPVLTASGDVQTAVEQVPTTVDPAITVTDLDSPTLAQVTAAITDGFVAGQDVLALSGFGGYGDISDSYDAATGVLTLTSAGGAASLAQWQAAMRQVSFVSSSDDPSSGRVITFTAIDDTGASGQAVRVLATPNSPDAAVVVTSAGVTAAGEIAPVIVDAGLTLSDPDDPSLLSASIAISGGHHADQDVLAFTGGPATGAITGAFNAATGVLSLTGIASIAQWQAALSSVTYANTSQIPDEDLRTITFTVNDGSAASTLAVKQLSVTDNPTTPPGFLLALLDDAFEAILRIDPHSAFALQPTILLSGGSTVPNPAFAEAGQLPGLAAEVVAGTKTLAQAIDAIQDFADASTSVATLAYQFFTDKTPLAAGYDFLVHSEVNPNDLSDPYYAKFNLENRFINFAVNLGKLGQGALQFSLDYGALSLQQAMGQAYAEVFGFGPAAGKIDEILGADVGGQTRAQYLALYGGDGPNGIGTKAAGVGFLLAEALKADLGPYASANAHFLDDLADGQALFNVNLLGVYAAAVET